MSAVDIQSPVRAIPAAKPRSVAPVPDSSYTDEMWAAIRGRLVGSTSEAGHITADSQPACAGLGSFSPDIDRRRPETHPHPVESGDSSTGTGHTAHDIQTPRAGSGLSPAAATPEPNPISRSPLRALRIWAKMHEDAQKARIACTNRAERGGVDTESYTAQLAAMRTAETEMAKALHLCFRRDAPPGVVAWQKANPGIGEHLLALLLGVIGHPVYATPYHWEGKGRGNRVLVADEPYERSVSQLWSYCGHGDPNRKRRKGMTAAEATALGNPDAKTLTHLLAKSCIQAGIRKPKDAPKKFSPDTRKPISRYGQVYYDRRVKTWDRQDWTAGHKQNDALRIVGKAILKDLWLAAQTCPATHLTLGGQPEPAQ